MLSYNAKFENGRLVIVHKERLLKELQAYEGKQLIITIDKKKKSRSSQQNRFYHGVLIPIVLKGMFDAGFSPMEVDKEILHELLKSKFLKKEIVSQTTGEVIELNNSTTKLTTTEFMDFIADIQQWAATYLNCYVPDPNEII